MFKCTSILKKWSSRWEAAARVSKPAPLPCDELDSVKKERYSETLSHARRTWSISSALASWLLPSGQRRPIAGNSFARDSLESSVPKELMVMLIVRRSASKARMLCITSDVGEPRVVQKL